MRLLGYMPDSGACRLIAHYSYAQPAERHRANVPRTRPGQSGLLFLPVGTEGIVVRTSSVIAVVILGLLGGCHHKQSSGLDPSIPQANPRLYQNLRDAKDWR